MADLSDVENALKAIALQAAYPTGTGQPSKCLALDGVTPVPLAVSRGWPVKEQLERDLATGVQQVTIFVPPQSLRITSREPGGWFDLTNPTPTIAVAVNEGAGTFTLTGYVETPQNVALFVNDKAYIYACQQEDTLANVATGLVALISQDLAASSVGAVVTVVGAYRMAGRVGLHGAVQRVLRQQEQLFHVIIWASTPELRDAVSKFIDGAYAGVGMANRRDFISLPDSSMGKLMYRGTRQTDIAEMQGLYRRELVFAVEYATTETVDATPVLSDPISFI